MLGVPTGKIHAISRVSLSSLRNSEPAKEEPPEEEEKEEKGRGKSRDPKKGSAKEDKKVTILDT